MVSIGGRSVCQTTTVGGKYRGSANVKHYLFFSPSSCSNNSNTTFFFLFMIRLLSASFVVSPCTTRRSCL